MPSTTLMAVSIVDRVRRHRHAGGPSFCVGHGVLRQVLVIQVREDREVDDSQRAVVTGGRLPVDEVLPDTGGHHHAPGAQPHPDRLAQRRQRDPPVRTAASSGTGTGRRRHSPAARLSPGPRDPALFTDAGQRGELQHSQGLPTQLAHGAPGFLSADEPPCRARTGHGVPVRRGGNAEGAGLGNRFAQQVDQRVVDARVLDASGREKKPQVAPGLPVDVVYAGSISRLTIHACLPTCRPLVNPYCSNSSAVALNRNRL